MLPSESNTAALRKQIESSRLVLPLPELPKMASNLPGVTTPLQSLTMMRRSSCKSSALEPWPAQTTMQSSVGKHSMHCQAIIYLWTTWEQARSASTLEKRPQCRGGLQTTSREDHLICGRQPCQ